MASPRAPLVAVLLVWALRCTAANSLRSLPLKPLVSTPTELLLGSVESTIYLQGQQAITVLFSRPVIALGSDFGKEEGLPDSQIPFFLDCGSASPPPGKLRWVTTTIARFDPTISWPPDLTCTFTLNAELESFDGVKVRLTDAAPRKLATQGLTASVAGVTSRTAEELTSGVWSANQGLPDDLLPEIPADGVITLSFSYPVSAARVAEALRLEPNPDDGITLNVTATCGVNDGGIPPVSASVASPAAGDPQGAAEEDTTCLEVRFSKELERGSGYSLVLPAGSRYSSVAGTLQEAVSVRIAGLRAFRIPFRQDFPNGTLGEEVWDGSKYRRLSAWLPHGLKDVNDVPALAELITLCELTSPDEPTDSACETLAIESVKLVGKAVLQLSVPGLQPRRKYRIAAAASPDVLDGFSQPLQASETEFWSLPLEGFLSGPIAGTAPVFVPGTLPPTWPIVSRGTKRQEGSYQSWGLPTSNWADIHRIARVARSNALLLSDVLGKPHLEVDASGDSVDPRFLSVPLNTSASVNVVARCCGKAYVNQSLINEDVQIILSTELVATWVVASGQQVLVWLTRSGIANPGPVAGGTAYLYSSNWQGPPKLLGRCTTNSKGFCSIAAAVPGPGSSGDDLFGFVTGREHRGLTYTPSVGYWSASTWPEYAGALALDRALVRPGDALHVTGYVAQRAKWDAPLSLGAPNVTEALLEISPGFKSATTPTRLRVELSPGYGSLHTSIPIPDSATGSYSLTVYVAPSRAIVVPSGGRRALQQADTSAGFDAGGVAGGDAGRDTYDTSGLVQVASESFTVSDPRPPTADLTITVNPWAQPYADVAVKLQAVSYLGSSVSDAAITVTWYTGAAQGVLELITDGSGAAEGTIYLGDLPAVNRSSAGDVLSLEATWIGPTRERIVRSATVRLEDGPRRLEVQPSLTTNLPGAAFSPITTLINSSDGSAIKGIRLGVRLIPNKTAGAECDNTAGCVITSGDATAAAACQLRLPCVGVFILEACTQDKMRPQTCGRVQLGLNATQWAASPLSSFDTPVLRANATQYALGDVAGLTFQNPWPKASALLVWGSAERTTLRTQLFPTVPQGGVTVALRIRNECRAGCAVALLLAVPRNPEYRLPKGVVVSKLFDPQAAHSHVVTLEFGQSLKVLEPRRLEVDVEVTVDGAATAQAVGVAALPIVAPGGNATVTVSVASTAGKPTADAEVTLLAVDKALLDLLPYGLPDLATAVSLDLASQLSTADSSAYRVAPQAVSAVFDALKRRLGIDPWLPISTNLLPDSAGGQYFGARGWSSSGPSSISPVDQDDQTFLDQYVTPLTVVPAWYGGCIPGLGSCSFAAGPGDRAFFMLPAPSNSTGAKKADAATVDPASVSFSAAADTDMPESNARDGAAVDKGGNSAAASPRLTSAFQATPLFTTLKTGADGKASTTFTGPPNLGTFVVRAYAVANGAAGLGAGTASLVVRRKLSLTASVPRLARVGDTFLAGVLVTSPGLAADAESFSVSVTITLTGPDGEALPLTLTGDASQEVTLSGDTTQQEVRFNLTAAALGNATLDFTASDPESGASDALQVGVPVLGQQGAVFVGTSFAVRPEDGTKARWQEGLDLPDALAGSGSLDVTAGVGSLPAILAATNAVAARRVQERDDSPLDAYTALALAAVAPLLGGYYKQELTEQQADNASLALAALQSLTDPAYGLTYLPPSAWYPAPTRADIILNAQGAWLLGLFDYEGSGALGDAWGDVASSKAGQWRTAAVRQLLADVTASRSPPQPQYANPAPYTDYYTIAWVRLALGAGWELPVCGTPAAVSAGSLCAPDGDHSADVSLATQLKAAPSQDLLVQLLTALSLQASPKHAEEHSAFLANVSSTVVGGLRITGRSAYVSAAPGAAAAAGLDIQALALRLLVNEGSTAAAAAVQKLAAYVAALGDTGAGAFTSLFPPLVLSPWVTAVATSSLAAYDKAAGSTKPDLRLKAAVGSVEVLTATFTEETLSAPPVRASKAWGDLPSSPRALKFTVTGTGEASVSVGLSFQPARPLTFPTYRGISVSTVVQQTVAGNPAGQPLASVPLGTLVTVSIQVITPDDLGAVTVEALVPGGLEPLDPALTSGAGAPSPLCPLSYWLGDAYASGGGGLWSWWWPTCPTQEIRPRVVTWRWNRLPAGTHVLQYAAVAATQGQFMLPPIKASADDQPEVMGLTAAKRLEVCGADCTPEVDATASVAPKDCPADCNGVGACNTASGECVCKDGWRGAACEEAVTE